MTRLPGEDSPGATPLEDEDIDGLIPTFVATRGDLNVVEQANIEKATRWALRRRAALPIEELFSVSFTIELHRRMFGDVWRWAGQQRPRETGIGVEPSRIMTDVRVLLDDAIFWHQHDTYPATERAVRVHHRLVSVHPFRNGNGRHSRFLADVYLHQIGAEQLTWGAGKDLVIDGDARKLYIASLRIADGGDIGPLHRFALS